MTSFKTVLPGKVSSEFSSNECLGVVLAGGLSSRMGQDKAKLLRNTTDMLNFSKQLLINSGVNNVVVSGNEYDIPDKVKNSGPVGGIYSVLSNFPQTKSLLILPVDLPFMTTEILANLRIKGELSHKATYFEDHHIPLYLPNNAYIEMFFSKIFSNNSLINSGNISGKATKKNGPSIKALLQQIPHQAIQCGDSEALFNTNTPEQWQQAKKQFNF
ncbi:molybdenum cofactor guanylyltransferase [Candidatus Colwellia aromaticivorans]|uniref:molybdenum cofactor guanylyltransferase n=1 Tax=Candidatus Colwellia aromaticivorans TaxID=2267621 RepID=UPI000DF1911D|nr:molybdenum cofactor guanylyltransferase [Candidatus Colwellia aromaticivorans]